MDDVSRELIEALVEALPPYLDDRIKVLGIEAPPGWELVCSEAATRLRAELDDLLSRPFPQQRSGPLEMVQSAVEGPTEALRGSKAAPVERDDVVRSLLPGDVFALAPASSRALGERAWRAHLAWGAAKAAWMTRRRRPMIKIDRGRHGLPSLEAGEGLVALLVHGFPLDSEMWVDQLAGLAGRRHVVAPDLRGHGDSVWQGDDVHAMDLLADDLISLIEAEQWGQIDLVGFSMGGYVALSLIERRPDLVRTLALVDTKATADSPEGKAGRDAAAAGLLENDRAWLSGQLAPKLMAADAPALSRARLRSMIERQGYETSVADLAGMRDRPDRSGVLQGISVPVSIIVGELDVVTPVADSEAMAAACPHAGLVVLPGIGHLAPMEAPEAVNQALDALWSGTRPD